MKYSKKKLLEFIDQLKGGDSDMELSYFKKTIQELIDSGVVNERDIVNGSFSSYSVPFRYKNCNYDNSRYLERFLSTMDDLEKKTIKEDSIMNRKKSVISLFLEDLENGRGLVGVGKEDDVLGAPGFDSDETIDGGLGDVADFGDDMDDELDAKEDELFGDDRVDKDAVTESKYIKTKAQYIGALNALFHNLAELNVISYLDPKSYKKQEHKIVVESLFNSIIHAKKPVLWESLSTESKITIAKKVSYFQEKYEYLLARASKKSASVVENYLIGTNKLLKEIDNKMSSLANPTMAP